MTKSEIASMIAESVKTALSGALKFQAVAPAPAVVEAPATRKPAAKGKRTLSDEQKAKMAEGRKRAAAAKAGAFDDAPATVIVDAPKPVKEKKARPAWEVKDHTTKQGVKGQIVTVGPFSAWVPEGDAAKRKACIDAINLIRTDAAHEIARSIR